MEKGFELSKNSHALLVIAVLFLLFLTLIGLVLSRKMVDQERQRIINSYIEEIAKQAQNSSDARLKKAKISIGSPSSGYLPLDVTSDKICAVVDKIIIEARDVGINFLVSGIIEGEAGRTEIYGRNLAVILIDRRIVTIPLEARQTFAEVSYSTPISKRKAVVKIKWVPCGEAFVVIPEVESED